MRPRALTISALCLALLLGPACKEDHPGGGLGGGEGEGEPLDGGIDEDAADADDGQPPKAELVPSNLQPVQVTFFYPREDDGTRINSDLYITNEPLTVDNLLRWKGDRRELPQIKSLTGDPDTGESLINCASCTVSGDGKFLTWADVNPGTGRAELFVAPIDPGWSVRFDRKRRITGVDQGTLFTKALGFAKEWLVYGVKTGPQSLIVLAEKAVDGKEQHRVHQLVNGGGFVVDADGDLIITMETISLAAMTVASHEPASGGRPVVMHTFEVDGGGTGSDYRGTEAAGVSYDNRFLAVLTEARERTGSQGEHLLNIVETNPLDEGFGFKSQVRLGPAGQGRCTVPRQPGEFVTSPNGQPPVWAPDGTAIYVLGLNPVSCRHDFTVNETEILRIAVDDNGVLGEPENITRNRPDADHPARVAFDQLTITPDGLAFIITAKQPDRVRRPALYYMPTRVDEVYDEILAADPGVSSLYAAMIRLTSSAKQEAKNPQVFSLR
jgi:hypothetical protein